MKKPIHKLLLVLVSLVIYIPLNAQNCIMNCKDTAIIALNGDCKAIVTSDQIYINPADCPGPGDVHVFDYLGNDLGNQIDGKYMDSILNVEVIGAPGASFTCAGKVWIKDLTPPQISVKDITINCVEANNKLTSANPPIVVDNCSGVKVQIKNEQYYPFSCTMTGFQEYFKTVNWKESLSCLGDGEIDISGSPVKIALIGANNTIDTSNTLCSTEYSIKIPAKGKISFDWNVLGNGDLATEVLGVNVNGNLEKLSLDSLNGTFHSGELTQGDDFSLVLYSNGDANNMKAEISQFTFQTEAIGLIEVKWKANDKVGNISYADQQILIEPYDTTPGLNLANIPEITINCGNSYDPDKTGWPFGPVTKDPLSIATTYLSPNSCVFISYKDSIISGCGGSFIVHRKWTLVAKCSGATLSYVQLIHLIDNTAPVITKPKDLSFTTDLAKCSGTINLPALKAVDACSPGNITINVTTSFGGSGSGPFTDVPIGEHTIFYAATDACGNSALASSKIIVNDNVPPKVYSKVGISIYLDKNGKGKVIAKDLDNGSTDNCCIQSFKVKRVTEPVSYYADEILLNCNDLSVGSAILCIRVYDCHGNYTDGNVVVIVKDNIAPVVTCPIDKTISCSQDVTNLDAYGKMTYVDNCTDQVLYSVVKDLGSCSKGTIKRTWKVSDASGNVAYCSHTITVKYDQTWNQDNNKIVWPLDYNISSCKTLNDLQPPLLPIAYKQPVITGITACASLFVDFKDNIISNSGTGCISIERNWEITDYCQYEASQGKTGKWTHKQVLKISDNQAPVISLPADLTVTAQGVNCSAYVSIPKITGIDCDPNLVFNNSANGTGADISGNYDLGANLVTITATDHCGNSSAAFVKITVRDLSAPLALCKQSVNLDLAGANVQGEKLIDVSLVNNNSTDNCTSQNNLSITVFPDKISCSDIGNKSVLLQVADQSGNTSNCTSIINVTDNTNVCGPTEFSISGNISTPSNKAVEKVNCNVYGGAYNQDITGVDGFYLFDNLLAGKEYTIKPSKILLPLNGVSTFDLILLNDHILGKKFLDSPYKYVAADVNNNKKISTSDYVAIRDLILLNTDKFAKVDSWRFIPASYVFPNYQPTIPDFPEELIYTNLQQEIDDADFIGVKMGDLNNNSNPSKATDIEVRSSDIMELEVGDMKIFKNEYLRIPVIAKTNADIRGFQFAFDFKSDLMTGATVSLGDNTLLQTEDIGDHIASINRLLVSWLSVENRVCCINENLFYIEGFANKDFKPSELISLEQVSFKPEIYNQNREVGEVKLKWTAPEKIYEQLIESIQPNPFTNKLEISLTNPIDSEVDLSLSDIRGNKLITKTIVLNNQSSISMNDLDKLPDGIYLLKVKTGNSCTIKKVVKQTP